MTGFTARNVYENNLFETNMNVEFVVKGFCTGDFSLVAGVWQQRKPI